MRGHVRRITGFNGIDPAQDEEYRSQGVELIYASSAEKYAVFDRLPSAVRQALNDAPVVISPLAAARQLAEGKSEADVLRNIEATVAHYLEAEEQKMHAGEGVWAP